MSEKVSQKQLDILGKGEELFWKFGVKRVPIEEICREASVSKMTFYKFFPNKSELAIAILEKKTSEAMEVFDGFMKADISFAEKLEKIFHMKLEAMQNMSAEFIKDIYSNPDLGIMPAVQAMQEKHMAKVMKFYADAIESGQMRKEVSIPFILSYTNQIVKMMEDETLMSQYDSPKAFIAEAMQMMFYGIVES